VGEAAFTLLSAYETVLGTFDQITFQHRKNLTMNRKFALGLTLLALVVAAPLLSACHTTAGAGQDISATGQAIDKAAVKATP
jgi:predicted small secreted protein